MTGRVSTPDFTFDSTSNWVFRFAFTTPIFGVEFAKDLLLRPLAAPERQAHQEPLETGPPSLSPSAAACSTAQGGMDRTVTSDLPVLLFKT